MDYGEGEDEVSWADASHIWKVKLMGFKNENDVGIEEAKRF